MVENAKCAKRRRKNKEMILKLCSLICRDWLAGFASNLVCGFAQLGGISAANVVEFR